MLSHLLVAGRRPSCHCFVLSVLCATFAGLSFSAPAAARPSWITAGLAYSPQYHLESRTALVGFGEGGGGTVSVGWRISSRFHLLGHASYVQHGGGPIGIRLASVVPGYSAAFQADFVSIGSGLRFETGGPRGRNFFLEASPVLHWTRWISRTNSIHRESSYSDTHHQDSLHDFLPGFQAGGGFHLPIAGSVSVETGVRYLHSASVTTRNLDGFMGQNAKGLRQWMPFGAVALDL